MGIEQKYFQAQVENASPLGLVVLLYDGAIRFIKNGKRALEEDRATEASTQIMKARNIVTELMVSLDAEAGGDLAKRLMCLYVFIYEQLVFANIYKDTKYLDDSLVFSRGCILPGLRLRKGKTLPVRRIPLMLKLRIRIRL